MVKMTNCVGVLNEKHEHRQESRQHSHTEKIMENLSLYEVGCSAKKSGFVFVLLYAFGTV